jgi:hypothetical protein
MATVFDLVKEAGSIPLDELEWRSPADAESVKAEVADLASQGLVELHEAGAGDDEPAVVVLTVRGFKQTLAT